MESGWRNDLQWLFISLALEIARADLVSECFKQKNLIFFFNSDEMPPILPKVSVLLLKWTIGSFDCKETLIDMKPYLKL